MQECNSLENGDLPPRARLVETVEGFHILLADAVEFCYSYMSDLCIGGCAGLFR